ncbi:hypothetical protein KI387_028516, partial [Taxus chinensis]
MVFHVSTYFGAPKDVESLLRAPTRMRLMVDIAFVAPLFGAPKGAHNLFATPSFGAPKGAHNFMSTMHMVRQRHAQSSAVKNFRAPKGARFLLSTATFMRHFKSGWRIDDKFFYIYPCAPNVIFILFVEHVITLDFSASALSLSSPCGPALQFLLYS